MVEREREHIAAEWSQVYHSPSSSVCQKPPPSKHKDTRCLCRELNIWQH